MALVLKLIHIQLQTSTIYGTKQKTCKNGTAEAKLKYPIALMTADELTYAGGYKATSLISPYAWYYLNSAGGSITGKTWWWSLSPMRWSGSYAYSWIADASDRPGYLGNIYVSLLGGVRPAISLKSCVKYSTGNGTSKTPYEIVENGGC